MNPLSGIVSGSSFFANATTPCRHVDTAKNSIAPTASGTQPPSSTFIMLAATNERSMMANSPDGGHAHEHAPAPHTSRMATNINSEVSST
jgi:hypothetical protein